MRETRLDGLRGVASLIVVLAHVTTTFLPTMYFGSSDANANGVQIWFSQSPLFVMLNGSLAVFVFFVLSGYVLSASVDNTQAPLHLNILARFVRLSIPCSASVLFAFLLFNSGISRAPETQALIGHFWFKNIYSTIEQNNYLLVAINEFLGSYYFTGKSKLNAVLWTMQKELLGSLAIYAIFTVFRSKPARALSIILITICLILSNIKFSMYICFAAGSFIYLFRGEISKYPVWLGATFLVSGLLLGGKPFSPPKDAAFFEPIYRIFAASGAEAYILIIAATLIVLCALCSAIVARALEGRACQFLGKISFSVYLVHFPILVVMLTRLFVDFGAASYVGFCLSVIAYMIAVYLVALVFTAVLDEPAIRLSRAVKALARSSGPDRQGLRQGLRAWLVARTASP